VQGAESILGPVNQVSSPSQVAAVADPVDQKLQQEQKQESDEGGDDDDGSGDAGTDSSLGLINSGPVQLKNDLETPVTSGGMDTVIVEPGTPD